MLAMRTAPALLLAAAAAQLVRPEHVLHVAAGAICALSPAPVAVGSPFSQHVTSVPPVAPLQHLLKGC